MTKIEIILSAEYGIMFLHDPKNIPEIPANAGEIPVTYTASSVAFTVLSYVDGDAKIVLCGESIDPLLSEYFSGVIECPSKSISVSDHNNFVFASVPLTDTFAKISLRMSEEQNSDVVECVIENLETF